METRELLHGLVAGRKLPDKSGPRKGFFGVTVPEEIQRITLGTWQPEPQAGLSHCIMDPGAEGKRK